MSCMGPTSPGGPFSPSIPAKNAAQLNSASQLPFSPSIAASSSCVTLGSTASFRTFRSSFALVSFGPFGSNRTLTYGHVAPPGALGSKVRVGTVVAVALPEVPRATGVAWSWRSNSSSLGQTTLTAATSTRAGRAHHAISPFCAKFSKFSQRNLPAKEHVGKGKRWPNYHISYSCRFKEAKRIHN